MSTQIKRLYQNNQEFVPITLAEAVVVNTTNIPGLKSLGITTLDKVIMINISEDIIIARLSNRRMCSQCNQPTRVEWLVDGKCEKCGGEVYQRDDDKPEIIKNRLEKQDISKEMIEFYENKGIFYSIESTNAVEKTFALIDEVIKKQKAKYD